MKNKTINIPYSYLIDKYPVSRRKYFSFILYGGFTDQRYWHDRSWSWITSVWDWAFKIKDPEELLYRRFSEKYIRDKNHWDFPITSIIAYEAEAYARWCGGRLPNEYEWEKAARGTDGRLYPWGKSFKKGMCHTKRNMEFQVDAYPEGVSPYGCYNMAGNKSELIGQLAAPLPSDIKDEILTRGGLDYVAKKGEPKYGLFGRTGCFPISVQGHNITFRCVYPIESPFYDIM